jgi:hypothetical protein
MLNTTLTKRSELEFDGKLEEILVLRDQASKEGVAPCEEFGQVMLAKYFVSRVSDQSGAAVKLGVPASTLESKIRSLRIDKYVFKTN